MTTIKERASLQVSNNRKGFDRVTIGFQDADITK